MTLSLYQVCGADYEWACFIFEATRNRAKLRVAEHFGEDYINMRCKTLARGINVEFPMIVDCPEDKGYELVQQLGFHYAEEDEYI